MFGKGKDRPDTRALARAALRDETPAPEKPKGFKRGDEIWPDHSVPKDPIVLERPVPPIEARVRIHPPKKIRPAKQSRRGLTPFRGALLGAVAAIGIGGVIYAALSMNGVIKHDELLNDIFNTFSKTEQTATVNGAPATASLTPEPTTPAPSVEVASTSTTELPEPTVADICVHSYFSTTGKVAVQADPNAIGKQDERSAQEFVQLTAFCEVQNRGVSAAWFRAAYNTLYVPASADIFEFAYAAGPVFYQTASGPAFVVDPQPDPANARIAEIEPTPAPASVPEPETMAVLKGEENFLNDVGNQASVEVRPDGLNNRKVKTVTVRPDGTIVSSNNDPVSTAGNVIGEPALSDEFAGEAEPSTEPVFVEGIPLPRRRPATAPGPAAPAPMDLFN